MSRLAAKFKAALLAALVLGVTLVCCRADQQILNSDHTFQTPFGRVGYWKITLVEPTFTQHEFWFLFGRLGRFHVKGPAATATPLLPIALVMTMAGLAIALSSRQRAKHWEQPVQTS